jgi:hypothetical protein
MPELWEPTGRRISATSWSFLAATGIPASGRSGSAGRLIPRLGTRDPLLAGLALAASGTAWFGGSARTALGDRTASGPAFRSATTAGYDHAFLIAGALIALSAAAAAIFLRPRTTAVPRDDA